MQRISVRYHLPRQSSPAQPALSALPQGASFAAAPWGMPSMHAQQDASLQTLCGTSMGTGWTLRVVNAQFQPLAQLRAIVDSTLAQVVAQMSHWQADSDISRWNLAPAGTRIQLPAAFAQVLDAAAHWYVASEGAYDASIGALVQLWGFGPRADPLQPHGGHMPSPQAIAHAQQCSGWARVQWDGHTRCLLQPGGVQLDLSGIAKGFAVDAVVQQLQQAGFADGLLEIGGELKAWGQRPDGQAWHAALSMGGAAADQQFLRVPLQAGALATSGDGWHAFTHDGVRYSHTIDPRTGCPVPNPARSVTVWHAQCMHADALATVLTVLGAEAGWAFALREGIAAVWQLEAQSAPRCTPAWLARFSQA